MTEYLSNKLFFQVYTVAFTTGLLAGIALMLIIK